MRKPSGIAPGSLSHQYLLSLPERALRSMSWPVIAFWGRSRWRCCAMSDGHCGADLQVCAGQEIGIRMALGASPAHLQGRILVQTLGLAALGMALGLTASRILASALGSLSGCRRNHDQQRSHPNKRN